jgi:hypothetical protein
VAGENQGGLDLRSGGAAALDQRASGNVDESSSVRPVGVGSLRRLARRVSVLTLVAGMLVALVAWVIVLVYGAMWVVGRVPI